MACQYIQTFYDHENVDLYSQKTVFEGVDCFLVKDRNSKFEVIVGSAIELNQELIGTVDG